MLNTRWLLLAVGVVGLQGCQLLVQPPQLTLEGVQMGGLGLGGTTLNAHLQVGNPNFYDVKTQKVTYVLTVEGKRAGEGVLDTPFTVPGRKTVPLDFPVQVNWSAAMGGLRTALTNGKIDAVTTGIITLDTWFGALDFPYEVRTHLGDPPDAGVAR